MRKRTLIVILLVVIASSQESFCQKEDKLILKFAPLGLLEPYGKNIHLGSEFILKGPFSFELDLAAYMSRYPTRIKDRVGFKIKPEIRYYLNSKKSGTTSYNGFYIADELYFISDKFKRGDTYIHYEQSMDTNYIYYAFERIRRFELGTNVKIGYQSVTKIRISFDYYFGLGLKYYNGSYLYKVNDPICCPVMRIFEIPVNKGIRPSITFGIKLGYVLSKRDNTPNKNAL